MSSAVLFILLRKRVVGEVRCRIVFLSGNFNYVRQVLFGVFPVLVGILL